MTKASPQHLWKTSRTTQPWAYALALFVLFAGLSVYSLRSNNLHMATLRDKVYAADKAGTGIDEALQNLRDYVGHHMNTNLSSGENAVYPPIQLKYTYDRLINAKASGSNDANARIYTDAQKYCEAKIPTGFSGRYRISCIQSYVASHHASSDYINSDLYKFDFYSPRWSPDVAGWSLVLAVLSFFAFVGLLIVALVRRRQAR